jgi:hypothetical protein
VVVVTTAIATAVAADVAVTTVIVTAAAALAVEAEKVVTTVTANRAQAATKDVVQRKILLSSNINV